MAGSLSIDDYDALYLNRLKAGHALCHKEGMGRPVECAVLNDVNSHAISDQKINNLMSSLTSKTLHSYQAYQLDAWLGEAGKELVIKFFNSLVTLQSDVLNRLIGIAKDEMQTLLILKDIQYRMNDSFFSDYFTLQIMILLNKGIYHRNSRIPSNLKSQLYNVISNPSQKIKSELDNDLNIFWHPASSVNFIEDIIENLTIRYLRKNSLMVDSKVIESTVSSYLLMADKEVISTISQKVKNKMEGSLC